MKFSVVSGENDMLLEALNWVTFGENRHFEVKLLLSFDMNYVVIAIIVYCFLFVRLCRSGHRQLVVFYFHVVRDKTTSLLSVITKPHVKSVVPGSI